MKALSAAQHGIRFRTFISLVQTLLELLSEVRTHAYAADLQQQGILVVDVSQIDVGGHSTFAGSLLVLLPKMVLSTMRTTTTAR
ncbi:hypothetical protein FIV00_09250 [Labrenzia sp. THAF82]|nr:hypothetical protein FIV00_09250 [Labrenzia sp. THAF82]